MSVRTRIKQITVLLVLTIISSFYAHHCFSMWQKASVFSKDASAPLGVFTQASEFLSRNLGQEEIAMVPMLDVFHVLNPELRDSLINYKSLWKNASTDGIILKADTTREEVLTVRRYFISLLDGSARQITEGRELKYVVRDWNDPYAKRVFDVTDDDELMFLLREVRDIPFTLSTGWSSGITIYETVQYTTLFVMDFSSPPKKASTIPSDVQIQYDWNGTTIQKADPRVGLYLPLDREINSSRQTYFTMEIKPEVEDVELTIVFYYDKDGDGRFSGYDVDYVKSATFSQSKHGWVTGEWYKISQMIPRADDPIVQIAIILTGDENGAFTFRDLFVYTEAPPEVISIGLKKWLSENLKEDEKALVSNRELFLEQLEPSEMSKFVSISHIWSQAEVIRREEITREELLKVRSCLIDFLKEHSEVRYVVRDWVDRYGEPLFRATVSDEFMILLREVETMDFELAPGYSRIITVYERAQYVTLLAMNFSSPPEQFFTIPSDVNIQFDSNGTTIQKADPRVGLYLPLERAINASKQNYLSMGIRLDVDDLDLAMVFYYDKDGDGKFSGYDVDYVKSATFSQSEQGWVTGEWYKISQMIPRADDPIVQIAIILKGDNDGAVTFRDLAVYTEVPREV